MGMQCNDQEIKRYYHILGAYLTMAKQLDSCMDEDREFYQDVCFLFATKMKYLRKELTDQGFVFCR